MKKILLIGNQGSFLKEIKTKLSQTFDVLMFPESNILIKNDNILLTHYALELRTLLEAQTNLEAIVFLGGEVRNDGLMMRENFHKPLLIVNLAFEKKLEFLYLSSLAVYDGLDKSTAKDITYTSKEFAVSEYGRSKLKFDNKVATLREKGLKSFTLRPASIVGSRRMNSSVERVTRLAKRFSFLRYFQFDGVISYVTRSELCDLIICCLQGKLQNGVYLVANNTPVSSVIWGAIGKPLFYIPVDSFLNLLAWSFPTQNSTALKNLTNRLVYQSNHRVGSVKYKESMLADILDNVDRVLGDQE